MKAMGKGQTHNESMEHHALSNEPSPETSDGNTSTVPRVRSYNPLKVGDYVNPQEETLVYTTDLKFYEERRMEDEAMCEELLSIHLPQYDEYGLTDSDFEDLIINTDDEYLDEIEPLYLTTSMNSPGLSENAQLITTTPSSPALNSVTGYTMPPSFPANSGDDVKTRSLPIPESWISTSATQTIKTKWMKPKTSWMNRIDR